MFKKDLQCGYIEYKYIEKEELLMNYNIRGENMEVTPALRDYVEKKVGKLERYFDTTPSQMSTCDAGA